MVVITAINDYMQKFYTMTYHYGRSQELKWSNPSNYMNLIMPKLYLNKGDQPPKKSTEGLKGIYREVDIHREILDPLC